MERQFELVTTNWTAYEALSIPKSRAGVEVATDLWGTLSDREAVTLVDVTPEIERQALDLLFGFRDKTWGVVDCASLVVMEELGCRQVIAFDRHFVEASRQRGFEVLAWGVHRAWNLLGRRTSIPIRTVQDVFHPVSSTSSTC